MKHVIIIHGWENNSQGNWFPWLKTELKNRGYKVTLPDFPQPKFPQLNQWLTTLKKAIGHSTKKDLILVGHSLGVNLMHHYLQSQPKNPQIKAAICVSTPTDKSVKPYKPIHSFLERNFDWKKISQSAKHWFILGSDNDPYIPLSEIKRIPKLLGQKLILIKGQGHFKSRTQL